MRDAHARGPALWVAASPEGPPSRPRARPPQGSRPRRGASRLVNHDFYPPAVAHDARRLGPRGSRAGVALGRDAHRRPHGGHQLLGRPDGQPPGPLCGVRAHLAGDHRAGGAAASASPAHAGDRVGGKPRAVRHRVGTHRLTAGRAGGRLFGGQVGQRPRLAPGAAQRPDRCRHRPAALDRVGELRRRLCRTRPHARAAVRDVLRGRAGALSHRTPGARERHHGPGAGARRRAALPGRAGHPRGAGAGHRGPGAQ